MVKLEKKIWSFIDKNKLLIFFIIITLLSLFLRVKLYKNDFGDYDMFLKPWFEELKDNGGLKALSRDIGNYNAPYMTALAILTYLPIDSLISIKTFSVIFDYVCGIVVAIMALNVFKEREDKKTIALLLYSAVIFLPTVFLNSACWAQSDSIYTAFALISLLCLFNKKYAWAFVFLGISFSFKLQAIFILPLYILLYFSERKFSAFNFLWIIVACIVMCIPSLIFGNTLSHCLNTYVGQVGAYNQYITLNFPNFYGIFWGGSNEHLIENPNELLPSIGVICAIAIFVVIAYLVIQKKIKFDGRAIIEFGLWSVLICTFLLPSMHERYLFMGDILGILYLMYNKDKFYIPLGIELVSLYGYLYFLLGSYGIDIRIMSVLYFIIFVIYSGDMCKRYFAKHTDVA